MLHKWSGVGFSANSLASGEQKVVRRGISGLPKRGSFHMLFQYLAVPIVNATISAEQVLNEPS